ncbi:MAG: hypothetical protein ACTHNO_06030 [Ralstonia sp.]|uniref:AbiTii domain-containing protein n=1 Tax=Ralstonia sp. TaxID=54061 RepID=UPI003F8098D8
MKLIDEIIPLLSDSKGSLTDALLKTKVLMHMIGHKELAEWVTAELNGYQKDQPVPPYRVVRSRLVGHIANIVYMQKNAILPTIQLPENLRAQWENSELRQSISVLEHLAAKPDSHLASPVPPEFHHLVDDALDGFYVQKMWLQIEPTQVLHGLTEIRSRLLDFVLELKSKLGNTTEGEVKEAAEGLDAAAMFHNAVFGDNTTVVIGNNNTTTISNVKHGDFDSLAEVLRDAGVAQSDILELKEAITADDGKVNREAKTFGPAVRGWVSKMMEKVVNAAWTIELGVAGGLLTNALQTYYF